FWGLGANSRSLADTCDLVVYFAICIASQRTHPHDEARGQRRAELFLSPAWQIAGAPPGVTCRFSRTTGEILEAKLLLALEGDTPPTSEALRIEQLDLGKYIPWGGGCQVVEK